jgi:hypothetical protein
VPRPGVARGGLGGALAVQADPHVQAHRADGGVVAQAPRPRPSAGGAGRCRRGAGARSAPSMKAAAPSQNPRSWTMRKRASTPVSTMVSPPTGAVRTSPESLVASTVVDNLRCEKPRWLLAPPAKKRRGAGRRPARVALRRSRAARLRRLPQREVAPHLGHEHRVAPGLAPHPAAQLQPEPGQHTAAGGQAVVPGVEGQGGLQEDHRQGLGDHQRGLVGGGEVGGEAVREQVPAQGGPQAIIPEGPAQGLAHVGPEPREGLQLPEGDAHRVLQPEPWGHEGRARSRWPGPGA